MSAIHQYIPYIQYNAVSQVVHALYNIHTHAAHIPISPFFQPVLHKKTLSPLDMRRLRLLHHMLTPVRRRTHRRRRLVLGHIVADGRILRPVLADVARRQGGEEEREQGGTEADPDDDHCGRGRSGLAIVGEEFMRGTYERRMPSNRGTSQTFRSP
jgi:hypothetical protein